MSTQALTTGTGTGAGAGAGTGAGAGAGAGVGVTGNETTAPNTAPGATGNEAATPETTTPTGPNYDQFFTDNGGYERVQLTSKLGGHFLAPNDSYKIESFLDNLYELSESRYIDAVNKIAADHPEVFQSQLLNRMGTDEALRQAVLQNLGWNEKDYNGYRDFLDGKTTPNNIDPRDQKIADLERQNTERVQRETYAKHEQAFRTFTDEVNSPIMETMKMMSFPMDQTGQLTEEGKNAQRAFQALTMQIVSENTSAGKLYDASEAHFAKGEYQIGAMNQVSLKAAVKDAATQAAKQIGQWMAATAELTQLKAKMNGTTIEPGVNAGGGTRQAATSNTPPTSFNPSGYGRFSAENMRAEIKAQLNSRR